MRQAPSWEPAPGRLGGAMVRRSVLPSGVRVLTELMPSMRSATIGLWVPVGSRHETTTGYGSTHFLEHLLFKGTQRRSAQDIAFAFDSVGGVSNAFTAKEYTYYYGQVRDVDMPGALDVLLDMVTAPLLRDEDVADERGVILDELAIDEDDPDGVAADALSVAALGDHPLGRPIGGTPESVRSISPDQIREHYRRHYHPGNLVVTVAGQVDHDRVCDLVQEGLDRAGWTDSSQAEPPAMPGGDPLQVMLERQPQRVHVVRPLEQAHVMLGGPAPARRDPTDPVLQLFLAVLGGDGSSRLYQEIREKRGLVYDVHTFGGGMSDCGFVGVGTGCAPGNLPKVLELIYQQWADVAEHGVRQSEVDRVVGGLSGYLALGLEQTPARMRRLANAELFDGQFRDAEAMIEQWQNVTIDQIRELAEQLLGHPHHVCVVGPEGAVSDIPGWP